jgi:hypothetical protein
LFINANAFIEIKAACTAPGACFLPLPAGVLLSQMPVEVNLVANSDNATLVSVHATEAIAFTNAENIININIENMTIALEA